MADELIEWDRPLNTEEDIEWEDNLTKPIANTPYQVQRKPLISATKGQFGLTPLMGQYSQPELAAAQEGVDVDTGTDLGTAAGLGFSGNIDEQKYYLTQRLSEKFGEPIEVRTGPQSGMAEYWNPKTKNWTLATPSSIATFPIDATLGIAGGLGGFAVGASAGNVPGAVTGSILGSGVGGAAAEFTKLKIGKKIGAVDPNYPIGSDVAEAGFRGAAFDAAAQTILGGAKYARYWFKGSKAFGAKEAAELGIAAAKADKIVADIERKTGKPFRPTIGQKTIGAEMSEKGGIAREKALGYEAAISKDAEAGVELRNLQRSNEDALVSYLDASSDPLVIKTLEAGQQLPPAQANRNVVEGLTQEHEQLMANARALVGQLPEELRASEAGKIMRTALARADKKFKDEVETPAWKKYRDGTGYNSKTFESNVRVPWNDDVRGLMSQWDKRSKDAIIKAIQNDNSGLKLLFKEDVTEASKVLGPDGLPWKQGTKQAIEDVDLATLDDTIKWLRSDARQALKNQQGVTYNEKDLVSLERTLTRMRNDYLSENKPELSQLLHEAESASKMRANLFKHSAVGDLLVKDGPDSFKLADSDVIYRIITSKDDVAAEQFANLVKGYPEAAQQARQMIYALYRKAVIDPRTGAPSPKAHANFMREYGQVARNFFDDVDGSVMGRLGGMGTAIAKEEAKLKELLPRFKKYFGDVESLNANALASHTMTKFSKDQVKVALGMLKKADQEGLIGEWQHAVVDEVAKKLIRNGRLDQTQLTKLINDPRQMEVLETLLNSGGMMRGKDYVASLKVLDEALTMIRTKGQGNLEPQSRGLLVRIMRVLLPPFSQPGRVVSFGAQARTKAVPGEIYKALTDPQELSRLAKSTEKTMNQVKRATIIGNIGQAIHESNY